VSAKFDPFFGEGSWDEFGQRQDSFWASEYAVYIFHRRVWVDATSLAIWGLVFTEFRKTFVDGKPLALELDKAVSVWWA
jgi:hypothetical protein